jgi:hypothetical protein
MPFVDAEGNPQLNEEGQPIDYDNCGAIRVVRLEGNDTLWERFNQLATDAGRLLESSSPPIRERFPPATLALADAPLRWVCAIFDLAWARIPGSPLCAETDKSVRVEIDPDVVDPDALAGDVLADILAETNDDADETDDHVSEAKHENDSRKRERCRSWPKSQPWHREIPLADWPNFVKEHPWREAVRGVTDPPEWFSTLADVVQASVYAIDVLLADIATEAEKPRRETTRGKRPGSSKQAQSTQMILLSALLTHHRYGAPNPNPDAATQQELMQLTKLTQSTLSRAVKKMFGDRGMAAYKGVCVARTIEGFLKKQEDGSRKVEALDTMSLEEGEDDDSSKEQS